MPPSLKKIVNKHDTNYTWYWLVA